MNECAFHAARDAAQTGVVTVRCAHLGDEYVVERLDVAGPTAGTRWINRFIPFDPNTNGVFVEVYFIETDEAANLVYTAEVERMRTGQPGGQGGILPAKNWRIPAATPEQVAAGLAGRIHE